MAIYINFKGGEGLETVDEFDNRKEALTALQEYISLDCGYYYLSSRCTRAWREASKVVDTAA